MTPAPGDKRKSPRKKRQSPHDDNDESTPEKKPKIDYNDDIPEPEPGEDFPPAPSPVKKIHITDYFKGLTNYVNKARLKQ